MSGAHSSILAMWFVYLRAGDSKRMGFHLWLEYKESSFLARYGYNTVSTCSEAFERLEARWNAQGAV